MLDRRPVAIVAVAVLLLVGATLLALPRTAWDAPQEALESSATSSPITSAIDAGAATSLAGLLPTSDLYARGQDIITGLKSAVPTDAPSLTASQLDVVTATTRGAVDAAVQTATGITLDSSAHQALRSEAHGLMAGLLANVPVSPNAGTSALSQQLAGALIVGSISSFLNSDPHVGSSLLDVWARSIADQQFAWLDGRSSTLVGIVGSPALSDIRAFASGAVRAQLDVFPYSASQSQMDALGAFVGGEVIGIAQSDIASFPQGVSAPAAQELHAWFEGVASGQMGPAPWDIASDGAVAELATWAQALAASGPPAVSAGPGTAPTQATLEDLHAWGEGLSRGAYANLVALPGSTQDLRDDAAAYAQGLALPGIGFLLAQQAPTPSSPEGLSAYAAGLTSGAATLRGAILDSPTLLLQRYLRDLATAVTDVPPSVTPQGVQYLSEFGAAATDRITQRLSGVQDAAVPGQDPVLIDSMVTGLVSGLSDALNHSSPGGESTLLGALTSGLTTGFLQSKDPESLYSDSSNLTDATYAWSSTIVPTALFGPLLGTAGGTTTTAVDNTREFGRTLGRAPIEWATNKGANLTDQGFGTVDDIVWVKALAQQTVEKALPTLLTPNPPQQEAVLGYVRNVQANATNVNVHDALNAVSVSAIGAAASDFAEALLTPVGWIQPLQAKHEQDAAQAALAEMLANASTITKFTDPTYAQGVLSTLDAIGTGAARAQEIAARTPGRSQDQGSLAAAWVAGVLQPVLDAPAGKLAQDAQERAAWVSAETTAAILVVSRATTDQTNATHEYATRVVQWILDTPGRPLPDITKPGFPLLPWANATVNGALSHLPPQMTQAEIDAYVAYATGIAEAIKDVPTPDLLTWTAPQVAALTTYAGGLAAAAPTVVQDLHDLAFVVACNNIKNGNESLGCPQPPPCSTDCPPPCDPNCPPPPPPTCADDPQCSAVKQANETYNATQRYLTNVHAWATDATSAVLGRMPDTSPTAAGIAAIGTWVNDVLGDHGIVVNTSDPTTAWNGPRGPAYDFAGARAADVQRFADGLGPAYAALSNLTRLDPGSLGGAKPMADPLVRWEAALQTATADHFTDPAHRPGIPDAGDAPTLPPGPPADITDRGVDQLWAEALWHAVPTTYDQLLSFPSTPDLGALGQDYGNQLDYIVLNVIYQQGAQAAFATRDAAHDATPKTGALDAFATGLVTQALASSNGTLVQPASRDAQLLVTYYGGVAQGGVGAIAGFAGVVKDQQIPGIQAYAATLGDASWLPPPPVPEPIETILAPSPSSGTAGGSTPSATASQSSAAPETDPQTQAQDNLMAHAAGLASAAMSVPLDPARSGATSAAAYPTTLLAYVAALRDSGRLLPSISPDVGYPARLRAWANAEALGALTNPPTPTPDSLTPHPDIAMATAFVGSFASAAPWSLVDATQGDVSREAAFATAAIAAASTLTCPDGTSLGECASVGETLGTALGSFTPPRLVPNGSELPSAPTLTPQLASILGGLARGLPTPPGMPIDTGAQAATAQAILLALVPAQLGAPDAGTLAQATAQAVLAQATPTGLPPDAVGPTASAIALQLAAGQQLATSDASLAQGAAAYVAESLQRGEPPSPAHITELVAAFLSPASSASGDKAPRPQVTVSDGRSRLTNVNLDGSAIISGLARNTFVVTLPASMPAGTWEVLWSTGDPTLGGNHLALSDAGGDTFSGSLSTSDLAALASGTIRFVLQQTLVGGQGPTFDRDGAPYAYRVDRDSPTTTVTSPATTSGGDFRLAWTGTDRDSGVASYKVEVSDNNGAYRNLYASTTDTAASFTGAAGHAYAFRVTATDKVGNIGAPSPLARTSVPASAPKDKAPVITFLTPDKGQSFDGAVPVILQVSDPDGTDPMLKVCVRRANDATDFACPYEGSNASFHLDVSSIPDGRLRLHAIATDGTLSTEATSPPFTLDRAPPSFLGAAADLVADREGLVTAALGRDASSVALQVLDKEGRTKVISRDLRDDGREGDQRSGDGVWTAKLKLPAGDYTFSFTAKDASGKNATYAKLVTVKQAAAKAAGSPSGSGPSDGASGNGSTPTTPPPTPPTKRKGFLPGPGVLIVGLAIAIAAVAVRRRR